MVWMIGKRKLLKFRTVIYIGTPELELKWLPEHLEYAYLANWEKLPMMISTDLDVEHNISISMSVGEKVGRGM